MPAEKANDEQPDPLTLLGQVSPPAPEVLDRARQVLWSAVAAEMLASSPESEATGPARRPAQKPARRPRRESAQRLAGEPSAQESGQDV
jgi:hypothetical protein